MGSMAGHYRKAPQYCLGFDDEEMVVDNFAGGGGASTGIEAAIGRAVDVAINHDPDAIAMHLVNHPATKHYCEDVFVVDPREVARGRRVGLAWFSPDCKDFSKAKGGKPVDKRIRGLAWVAVRWAATVRPRIIILENVEEFRDWGPLVDGQRCKERKGETFALFVARLERLGYHVEHRIIRASDVGTPTLRRRLYLVARCDGLPIVWPLVTHSDPAAANFRRSKQKARRTAAECIDLRIPCPSIFTRKRPLADNTLRRIARGIQRYVIDNPRPFIIPVTHTGDTRSHSIDESLRTITCAQRGEFALVMAFLAKHFGGGYTGAGAAMQAPAPTVTGVDHTSLVTSHLVKLRGTNIGHGADEPLHTISAGGTHLGEVRAFLLKFYSEGGQWAPLDEPMHTIPTKDRLGLVTVHGEQYQIVDIGMRMLEPRELFNAQGFPADYVIDVDAQGNPIPKYKQVARCGNSVCPPVAEALVRANFTSVRKAVAA